MNFVVFLIAICFLASSFGIAIGVVFATHQNGLLLIQRFTALDSHTNGTLVAIASISSASLLVQSVRSKEAGACKKSFFCMLGGLVAFLLMHGLLQSFALDRTADTNPLSATLPQIITPFMLVAVAAAAIFTARMGIYASWKASSSARL